MSTATRKLEEQVCQVSFSIEEGDVKSNMTLKGSSLGVVLDEFFSKATFNLLAYISSTPTLKCSLFGTCLDLHNKQLFGLSLFMFRTKGDFTVGARKSVAVSSPLTHYIVTDIETICPEYETLQTLLKTFQDDYMKMSPHEKLYSVQVNTGVGLVQCRVGATLFSRDYDRRL